MDNLLDFNNRPAVYGSIFNRFIALIIDIAILGVIETILAPFVGHEIGSTMTFLIGATYYVGLETSDRQGTFGKSVMGLRVCDANGAPLTIGKSLLRYIGKYVSLTRACATSRSRRSSRI